ncbi:hypothetical protein [Dyella sedimenti]|uniref:hypothetical protein n=1 Tax=Dyella sedimenti TaxID=2919947 RepID=UPI001FAA0C89|nr:hypothetical protein [Dyella sedimenti]
MKKAALTVALIALAGCASRNVQIYSQIDTSSKTITVPAGAEGLKGKLKQALAQDGWKLVVYAGPSVTKGTVGAATKIAQYDTFNTRYQLTVSSNQFDWCFKGLTPDIVYDISVIDTKSGSEVLTVSGKGCEPDAVEAFVSALHGKGD